MQSITDNISHCTDDVKSALTKLFQTLFTKDVVKDAPTEGQKSEELYYLLDLYRREKDPLKAISKFIAEDKCTDEIAEAYRQASQEVKAEMGTAISLFGKKYFQWYFSGATAQIDHDENLTARNVATSRMAALFGISSIVSDSRTAVIKKDGKEVMGNVMENSRGKTTFEMQGDWTYSDKVIGQVYTLQVFDMICGQIDRHERNFHVIEKNGNVNSIKAIDNDMSFGNLTWNTIAPGYENISPLTECHVRAMPIAVINQILSLDEDILKEALGDVLESENIDYLIDRLSGIQRCIKQYAKNPAAGLHISADGKTAKFEGEDADDTLRMLKAVKQQRGHVHRRIDGGEADFDNDRMVWGHLKEETLDEKITKARTAWQNKQKKE